MPSAGPSPRPITTAGMLGAVYLAGLVVQLATLAAVRPPTNPMGDPGYAANAMRMLEGGYVDTFKPPLYSLFLTLPAAIDGLGYSVYLWQIAVYALSPCLTLLLCRRLGLGTRASWIAVVIQLTYPYYVFAFLQLLETGLAVLGLQVTLLAWLRARRSKGVVGYSVWGVSFGALALLRPNVWSLLPVFAFADRKRGGTGRIAAAYLLFGAGVLVAVFPWLQHTAAVNGVASLTPTNGGYNFLAGHNPYAIEYLTGSVRVLEDALKDHPELIAMSPGLGPLERDRELYRRGLAYVAAHPGDEVRILLLKLRAYWALRLERPYSAAKQAAYALPWAVVLLAGTWGATTALRQRRSFAPPLLGLLLAHAIPFLIFISTVRMRMPTEFMLMIFAGYGLDDLWSRWSGRRNQGPKI